MRALLGLRRPAAGTRVCGRHAATVEAARRYFRGQDVIVEPRKMWVSGLPGKKGKIGFLGEGRAMAYADDPAWSGVLADLWRQDGAGAAGGAGRPWSRC